MYLPADGLILLSISILLYLVSAKRAVRQPSTYRALQTTRVYRLLPYIVILSPIIGFYIFREKMLAPEQLEILFPETYNLRGRIDPLPLVAETSIARHRRRHSAGLGGRHIPLRTCRRIFLELEELPAAELIQIKRRSATRRGLTEWIPTARKGR